MTNDEMVGALIDLFIEQGTTQITLPIVDSGVQCYIYSLKDSEEEE